MADPSSDAERAGAGAQGAAVIALDLADADRAAALRDEVVVPALAGFPLDVTVVPLAPGADERADVCERIAAARVVVAQVEGAAPEVLVRLARRGPMSGRTVLLAPGTGTADEPDVLHHPPTARGVRGRAAGLRDALAATLLGDRRHIAASAEEVYADVLAGAVGRERRLRRIEASCIPVRDPSDPAVVSLARGYAALGLWADVERLGDIAAHAAGRRGTLDLPRDLICIYVVALNRRGRGTEAERTIAAHQRRYGTDSELCAALGRIHKDRWEAGGRVSTTDLDRAIRAYRRGFREDGNYYPGVNALTLMSLAGAPAPAIRRLATEVRQSVARGPNPAEHPWWHWATRVQVEVLAGDLDAADAALDGLLSQPSEPWMRQSTADDLARAAGRRNEEDPSGDDELEDRPEVRRILAIRQAALDGARTSRRHLPPHCVLEVTRRGHYAFANFTNREPRPLFCRYRDDLDSLDGVLVGGAVERIQRASATEKSRRAAMAGAAAQLAEHFQLNETSFSEEICADDDSYLVVQVDETTAVEPWELFAQDRETPLSLRTGFARRLWLETRTARRPTGRTGADRALVIGDPRDDLDAARAEASAVAVQLTDAGCFPGGVVSLVGSKRATIDRIMEELEAGGVDLLHYAGHGQGGPGANGFAVADDELLTPEALASAATTPVVIVANACSSAQIPPARRQPGFVTSLVAAGVGVYVGCAWPVGDAQARIFSEAFYAELLAGRSVGRGVRCGRLAIQRGPGGDADPSWPAYVLYGNPWYQLIEETPDPGDHEGPSR